MTKTKIENETEFKDIIRELKKAKAWHGTIDERKQKFKDTHDKLNALYGKNIRLEFIDVTELNDNIQGASGRSLYSPLADVIIMHRKLSVITFIFLWLQALNQDGDPCEATETANSWFKEIFPISGRKLAVINGLSVQTTEADNDANHDTLSDGEIPPPF